MAQQYMVMVWNDGAGMEWIGTYATVEDAIDCAQQVQTDNDMVTVVPAMYIYTNL